MPAMHRNRAVASWWRRRRSTGGRCESRSAITVRGSRPSTCTRCSIRSSPRSRAARGRASACRSPPASSATTARRSISRARPARGRPRRCCGPRSARCARRRDEDLIAPTVHGAIMRAMDLAERHVVITGAAGGLGPGVVEGMLAAGAICHLPVRADADRLPRHARILAVEGVNLTDEGAVTSFYARCPPLWASIHVAGGFKAALITDTSLADLRGQLDVNLATAFLCSREAVRNMRVKGRGGRIVNISSRAATVATGFSVAYTASKAAVSAMVRALADEVAEDRILVNAVLP